MTVLRRLGGNPVLRSMAGVGGFAAAGNLLGLAAAPILSRLFSAEDFGLFGLFFVLANVLGAIAMLGLQDALFAASSEDDLLALLKGSIIAAIAGAPLMGAISYGLIDADLLGFGALPGWTALLIAVEVPAIAMVMLLQLWHVRRKRFRTLAASHLALGGSRAAAQVGAGAGGLGFLGLGGAELLSRTVIVALLSLRARADIGRALHVPLAACAETVTRFRRFILFRAPSTLAFNIGTALPPALLTMAHGVSAAGLFTFMFSILVVPAGLVQKAAGDVFLGHFADRFQSDPAAARRFLLRTLAALVAVALPPAVVLGLFGQPLFAFVFGDAWREAGRLAELMVPLFIADIAIGPLGVALNVVNRPEAKLLFDVTRIGGLAAAYLITVSTAATLHTTVSLIAWFGAASYAVYLFLILAGTLHPRGVAGGI